MTDRTLKKKSSATWMVAGAAVFAIAVFAAAVDVHKAAAAEVKGTGVSAVGHVSTDGRGNPATADRDIAANVTKPSQTTTSFPADETKLAIGDRLKVSVYERLGSGTEPSSAPLLSTLVEHTEVSGEYTVQTDGRIFVPFIGNMDAAGETRDVLQQALEHKVAAIFKGQSVATVRLLQREPVYVTGSVPQPGSFKYTPGMMVLNAVILAGTMPAAQRDWQRLDLMRMTEHVQQTNAKLANLLARRDVLVAMRDGRAPTASQALSSLVGPSRAADLIAAAVKLADLKGKKYKNEQQALAADEEMLEKERAVLTESLNDARAALDHAKARMDAVVKLHKTGMTTDSSYYQAVGDLDAGQSRLNDLKTALARLERQIVAVREHNKKTIVEAKIAREQAIADLQASIAEAVVTRATLRPTLAFDRSNDRHTEMPQYKILRLTSSGIERIDADRFSFLKPGDIVDVVRNDRPLLDASVGPEK
jgi:exopolysaccharide production protein ExoF